MYQNFKKNKGAFTLIELIIVVAVIAILVVLAVPRFLTHTETAKIRHIQNDIKVLESKMLEYVINHGSLDSFNSSVSTDKQLYSTRGPVEASEIGFPDAYKVVDIDLFPETNLPGNFHINDNGDVVYEDNVNTNNNDETPGGLIGCGGDLGPKSASDLNLIEDVKDIVKSVVVAETPSAFGLYSRYDKPYILLYFEDEGLQMFSIEDLQRFMVMEGPQDPHYFASISPFDGIVVTEGSDSAILPWYIATYNENLEMTLGSCMSWKFLETVDTPDPTDYYFEFNPATGTITNFYPTGRYGTMDELLSPIIPQAINGEDVVAIGRDAFNNKQLTAVTIPEGIRSIGFAAFLGNYITEVSLPNTLTIIDERAFQNNLLVEVTIPNSVSTLKNQAFHNNNQLSSVTLGAGVNTIGQYAFGNSDLTQVTIPSNVSSVGSRAFYNSKITTVVFEGDTTLGFTVFGGDAFGKNNFPNPTLTGPGTYEWNGFSWMKR